MRNQNDSWSGRSNDALARAIRRLGDSDRLGLLLDYDGTLTPIVARPDEARLAATTRALLLALVARSNIRLGIVTGRGLEGLLSLTGELAGVTLAVNGGVRVVDAEREWIHPDAQRARPALERLMLSLGTLPEGALVEDKTYSVAIHYRGCPGAEGLLEERIRSGLDAALRVLPGKCVFEIQPRLDWDKGRAATQILDDWGVGNRCLFAGDDVIDAPALRTVRARGGVSIQVGGAQPTEAEWRVASPEALLAHLRSLAG